MNKKQLIVILVLLLFLGSIITYTRTTFKSKPKLYIPLKEINVEFYVNNSFSNKTVIDFFYSPSCPYCKSMLPILLDVVNKTNSKLFYRCIYIHKGDNESCIKKYGKDKFNWDMKLKKLYGVRGTPTLIINQKWKREGTIAVDKPDLEREDLLNVLKYYV